MDFNYNREDDEEECLCRSCGMPFWRLVSERWKTVCLDCYIEKKNNQTARQENTEILRLKKEINILKNQIINSKKDKLDAATLKGLIFLCHPDKHGNSEQSNQITRWLLNLYSEAKNGY